MKWMVGLVLVSACGGSGGDDGMSLGAIDARCKTLCASNEPACGSDVTACEQECQVRVQDMAPLCGTCLLEHSNGSVCSSGQLCCPSPEFPNSVMDCGSSCSGSVCVYTATNEIFTSLCSSTDVSCSAQAQSCLDSC